MMDQQCISSIIQCIKQSNMSDLSLQHVTLRLIVCHIDKEGNVLHDVKMYFCDNASEKLPLSEAWVAGNLLLFTAFDGYLENKYQLIEGASFRNHYDALPQSNQIELIEKNCYRIMKLIRNGIQHNMSNVNYNSGNYDINYNFRGTIYDLKITSYGIRCLYTIIINLIQGEIMGIYGKYLTEGHYNGILYTMYNDMEKEIVRLSDDIGNLLITVPSAVKLRAVVRYPVENPQIVAEDENTVTFIHIENNGTDDENSKRYYYSTDYEYKDYLLPQEIGKITQGEGEEFHERINRATICFDKQCIEEKWKINE